MKNNNYMRLLICFCIIIMILNAATLQTWSDNKTKNIFVLNSYHAGLTWADEQTDGILNVIKSYDEDSNIIIEYLDWKNYPTEENLEDMYTHLKHKYSKVRMDVIITTDDAALEFMINHKDDLFVGVPIVFSGVNRKDIEDIKNIYPKITGLTEIIDPEGTVKAALQINPDIKEIYVIFDNSESGKSTGDLAIKTIKSIDSDIKIKTLNDKGAYEILEELKTAPDNSIVLITTYYRDPNGLAVGLEKFTRKVSENSRAPVFHIYEYGINNGAVGGSMLSGKILGQFAGQLAVRILKGEDAENIPIETQKMTKYIFNYNQLERFGINTSVLPQGSLVLNEPFSFYETYKSLVVTAIVIFILLLVFIIILMIYLRKISRLKGILEENNRELEGSEKKLQHQYDELVEVQNNLISSENRYSLLFEKMLNGFFVFEPVINEEGKMVDIRLLSINPGFKVHIGVPTNEIIGKTWMEIFNYENQNLRRYHDLLKTGVSIHFETYYPNTGIYYLTNAFKISENRVGVVFDNITPYKKVIKEISMLNEDLENRVLERTEELQSVVSELEAFTYTVSHDLKSPLRAIDGYSRIIAEDLGSKLGTEGIEMVNNIRSICKDMIEMINKLLKYSTTSKADIVKEDIDIEDMFRTVFSELKSSCPERDIRLTVETGLPMVYADRIMLRQVVYNIFSNAIKFTKNKDSALISIGCTITGQEYVFYVKDNGAGFDMEFSSKLFGIFQRLHANDEFDGSGIGLVTVKKIIQRHGGQVWIHGKTDEGATLYFTLPLKQ